MARIELTWPTDTCPPGQTNQPLRHETGHIEALGNEPLLKIIKQLGGWPVLGATSGWSSERPFDWLDLLIKFRKMGFSHDVLIDLSVTPDSMNNTRYIINVS